MKKNILLIFIVIVLIFLSSIKLEAKVFVSTEKDYYSGNETILLNEEKLEKGYEYKNIHREFTLTNEVESINIVFNKSDEYLVMGKKNEKPYLVYFKEGNLIFEKHITECEYGIFADAIFDEDKIIAFGEIRYDAEITRLMIVEYNLNGVQTKKQEIYGDNRSVAFKIMKIAEEYFFVGETFASKLGESKNTCARGIVIGKLQKNNFSNYEIVIFGNDRINYVYDAKCIENRIYLLVHFSGVGYFNSGNSSNEFYSIVMFEDRLDMPIYESLKKENANDKSKIILTEDKVMLVSIVDKYKIEIDEREIYFKKIKKEYYDFYQFQDTIEKVEAFYENNEIILIASFIKDNVLYECRTVLDEDYNKLYTSNIIERTNNKLVLSNYKNYMFNTLYLNKDNNIYSIESNAFIQKKNDNVYINGSRIKGTEQETLGNEFGEKKIYNEFLTEEFNVLTTKTYYTPLEINVKNFSVYDIGLKLEFNATGYLNGEKIESGYVVNECNNYLLELYGSNNSKETIYFIVDKLTIDEVSELEKEEYFFSIDKYNTQTINRDISVVNDTSLETIVLKTDWYYFLTALVLGVLVAINICKKIERKKNND